VDAEPCQHRPCQESGHTQITKCPSAHAQESGQCDEADQSPELEALRKRSVEERHGTMSKERQVRKRLFETWVPRARPSLFAIPVYPDIMRSAATGDDLVTAVSVEVGREGVFAGHASVVDGQPVEGHWSRSRFRIEYENARPSRS